MTDSWSLGNAAVIEGLITVPIQGAWYAEVQVDEDEAPVAGAYVTLDASGTDYIGTVRDVSVYGGRASAKIVGGAGALKSELLPRAYQNVTFGIPLTDISALSGEGIDEATTAALSAISAPYWIIQKQEAQRAIQAIADFLSLRWRVLRSGKIQIALALDTEYTGAYEVLESDDTRGYRLLAVETCDAEPGQTIDGITAEQLVYRIGDGGQRLTVTSSSTGGALAAAAGPIRDMARMATTWRARVAKTNADGTVDVIADDKRIRGNGYKRIPLYTGFPGSVTVPDGSEVLLLFGDGTGAYPIGALFAGSGASSISLGAGTDFAALAGLVLAELQSIKTAFDSHTHTGVSTGGGVSGTPVLPMPAPSSVAASVTKVE